MEFYIAQAVSVITALSAIISLQCKSMRGILLWQIMANLSTAASYALLGGFSGAGICIIAIVQTVVMFFYSVKGEKCHLAVIILFAALYVACSVYYFTSLFDLFSLCAALCFALSVAQERPMRMRLWSAGSMAFWIIYDLFTKAYGSLIVHIMVMGSALLAIYRYRKEASE